MALLNQQQARVVDPILSTIAQGYQNGEMVANYLFPTVQVDHRGGNIIQFGKEAFMLYATQRGLGENTKRVSFGYAGAPFALLDYSLEGQVPVEIQQEAEAGPGIDMGQGAVGGVCDIMALRLEYQAANIARNLANYGAGNQNVLAGTSQWSDFSGVSQPIQNIETGKEAVRAATGKRPNTVVMGAQVFAKVKQHPLIVDRMKYTGRDVATVDILASLFGVDRVVVGDAIYSNDAGTAFTDVWGKDVVLAYTKLGNMQSRGVPSYGYTYQLGGYPQVEVPYFDRNTKSWIYPVTRVEAPVLASASAGYIIKNAVA